MDLSLIALLVSIIGLGAEYWLITSALRERLARLEEKIDLLWKALEKKLVTVLLSHEKHELDDLLLSFSLGRMTREQAQQLQKALYAELKTAPEEKKLAIHLMLGLVEAAFHLAEPED